MVAHPRRGGGAVIELRHASRWYGQVIGLNDVNATIGPGVTALLGQNGAGKTTMLRLITGQIRPTTGTVTVHGQTPFANPQVYRHLGYCPELDSFYEHHTGRQFVRHMARLHGFGAGEAARLTEEALERVGMADRASRKIQGYSKGMRQRIKLAQAMIHSPDVILLDEPLNGLDPVARREFIDLIGQLAAEGKAIVVSSHILHEVEQMTRNILLLHRGRLLATGDLRAIRSLIDKHPHRVRVESPEARRVAVHVMALPYVIGVEIAPDGAIEFECREPERFYDEFPRLALEEGLPITGFSSPDNNLEAVFRYLVRA
jgi:ABC-2 type transport system ATP-binding protein